MIKSIKKAKEEEQKELFRVYKEVLKFWKMDSQRPFSEAKSPKEILFSLRDAIKSSIYTEIDHKEEIPQVACLHDLCLATFAGADLKGPLENAVSWTMPSKIEDLFGFSRKKLLFLHPSLSDKTPSYLLFRFRFLWSAFLSTWLGSFLFKRIPFDPRGKVLNTAGKIFFEETHPGQSLQWTVGPTPTIGDEISFEMKGALQGLQNRLQEDVHPYFSYKKWIYVNLQSLQSSSERGRSFALLQASKMYPEVFRFASITVDAPFYLGKDSSCKTLEDHKKKVEDELEKSIDEPCWYAFSLYDEEKPLWKSHMMEVVQEAYQLSLKASETYKIASFHELVVLGLSRAWQLFSLKDEQGSFFSTIACKECADRGASVNASFLWAFSNDEERLKNVTSILWGRAFLSRFRIIQAFRTQGFHALIRSFSPEEVRDFLDS